DLNCNDEIQWSYVFDCDGSGNLTETDLYAWVPDCITEFNAFKAENGVMSIKNGYVAYCQTTNPSTGYDWTWNQSGDGVLTKKLESGCTEKYEIPPTGNGIETFILLKPEKDGKVNLNLVYERTFEPDSAINTIDRTFLISENCTKIEEENRSLNLPELKQGEARVIITDYDTGELIPEELFSSMEYFMMGTNIGYKNPNVDGGWMYTGPMFEIDSNPYYCDELAGFIDADSFGVNLTAAPQGYYLPDDYKVITINDNGSLEIEFRLKKYTKGDANGDGNFSIADAVLLQKWLLGIPDATLFDWKAADLCEDGVLNIFDLCMMKRELFSNTSIKPILTKAELRDIILSKEKYTWSDFEQYQSEDVGSGVYILKYKVDFDDEDIETYLYITGSDLEKEPQKIYLDVARDNEEEKLDIYEFRQQLIDFIDSFISEGLHNH
ncbi:MAG: dockerin type I domain-containing protein, partial [Oscillospiraceae bacterium]|nr:dockerin type I domain-containing protein [Oscillospiraceae bacterium]